MTKKTIKSDEAEKIIEQHYRIEGVAAICVWSDRTSSIWDICNWDSFNNNLIPLYVRINRPYVTYWEPPVIEV